MMINMFLLLQFKIIVFFNALRKGFGFRIGGFITEGPPGGRRDEDRAKREFDFLPEMLRLISLLMNKNTMNRIKTLF